MVLTLNHGMFTILDHDKFSPSTRGLYDPTGYYRLGGRSNITCKQNPTSRELLQGIYKPRLTVTKRFNREGGFDIPLKIEFSAPKMLFGNNFDELKDSDFLNLITKLNLILRGMGVFVYKDALENAPVSAIHYSKNIPLTNYETPYTYIKQLEKVNFNTILDTSKTDYFNGGSGIKAHANSYEIAFYDKKQDLLKAKISPKRAYEKDSQIQLGLFETIKRKPFEVLRMEIRLGKRQKLKQVLSHLALSIEPNFKNLFNQDIAQKVLLYYLQIIEKGYPRLMNYEYKDPEQFFTNFLVSNPDKKFTSALKYLGMRVLLEKMGIREFRQLISRYSSDAWYSLNSDMKSLVPISDVNTFDLLRNSISNYQPLKVVDYQSDLLNNDKYE